MRNGLYLAGSSEELTREIESLLNDTNEQHFQVCTFDSLQEQLGLHATCGVVCVAGCAADTEKINALVRDAHLRERPVKFIIVQAEEVRREGKLAALDRYILCRLDWPSDPTATAKLQQVVDLIRSARPHNFLNGSTTALTEALARRLFAQTPSLERQVEPLVLAASHDVTVLLTGPTGTGKTYLARIIHELSSRHEHKLMIVPCGALAPSLIESELFGHAKGSFTGADRSKVGKFEAVGSGTLLLDEIDTLALEQQAKLLRVIETGAYEAVGSNETNMCKARVLAASNWDLDDAVRNGKFREDLFYRLNVLAIHLEPLRERPQDIGPLARALVAEFSTKFHKPLFSIDSDAIAALEAFPWPGNIRQLENFVQQAVLVSTGPELLRQHLPRVVREFSTPAQTKVAVSRSVGSLVQNRDQHERTVIETALRETRNCRSRAADALGISRATLYNKMKKYGIPRVRMY